CFGFITSPYRTDRRRQGGDALFAPTANRASIPNQPTLRGPRDARTLVLVPTADDSCVWVRGVLLAGMVGSVGETTIGIDPSGAKAGSRIGIVVASGAVRS